MNPTETGRDPVFAIAVTGANRCVWSTVRRLTARTLRWAEPYAQSAVLFGFRLLYGWQFAQTGWGKLTHLQRTAGFFESIGIPAPLVMAAFVGVTELIGGLMFVLGVGTRFAATALTIVLGTALLTAHADEAFSSLSAFTAQEPFPFLVASLLLLVFGAGRLSVDGWLQRRRRAPDVD